LITGHGVCLICRILRPESIGDKSSDGVTWFGGIDVAKRVGYARSRLLRGNCRSDSLSRCDESDSP
jgi:hypothetical protein